MHLKFRWGLSRNTKSLLSLKVRAEMPDKKKSTHTQEFLYTH